MSKILDATCSAAGKVSFQGFELDGVTVLSEGKQTSVGLLFMQDGKAWFLPSSATDIKATLESVTLALTEIANALTAIGGGMTGPTTAPPPSLPSSVATINEKVATLNQLKGALK